MNSLQISWLLNPARQLITSLVQNRGRRRTRGISCHSSACARQRSNYTFPFFANFDISHNNWLWNQYGSRMSICIALTLKGETRARPAVDCCPTGLNIIPWCKCCSNQLSSLNSLMCTHVFSFGLFNESVKSRTMCIQIHYDCSFMWLNKIMLVFEPHNDTKVWFLITLVGYLMWLTFSFYPSCLHESMRANCTVQDKRYW